MVKDKYLLRLTTAGSVDDGKSTLIGRLLLDSGSLYQDQIKSIENIYLGKETSKVDLALFTDGLKEERELGITIDVAYRYFETPKCKFILADSPGHLEFTRNMITAASTCDVAVLLVDAQAGITEQTRRHAYLTSLLNINTLIICVNKMDLIGWEEDAYSKIVRDINDFLKEMEFEEVVFIPVSALNGDNVVKASTHVSWYKGLPLLQVLENVQVHRAAEKDVNRLPIQLVLEGNIITGKIAQGLFQVNDAVEIMPSGMKTRIKSLRVGDKNLKEASTGMSITMGLEGDVSVQRGEVVLKSTDRSEIRKTLDVRLCWLGDKPAKLSTKYSMHHATNEVFASIENISNEVDMISFQMNTDKSETGANAIVNAQIQTEAPLVFDSYSKNRVMGSFILVDCSSNETVAAGIIL